MKKILRYAVLLMSLLLLMSIPIQAEGTSGSGTDGDITSGGSSLDGKDGASPAKTGYLIWTSDGSGNATSPIVFRTYNGGEPYSTSGAPIKTVLTTRFGQKVTESQYGDPIIWGTPPFTGSSGYGTYIKNWLCDPHPELDDAPSGAAWVLANYLGYSDDEIDEWCTKEDAYLNVQDVMWGGIYSGTRHMGVVLCGSIMDWATLTNSNNYLSRYTHANMANGMAYDISFLGLAVPSNLSGKHESSELLSAVGYGIVSVKPVMGDKQLVQVFTTNGVVDQTSYSTCSEVYNVANRGDYKVVKWDTGKKKTKCKDTRATYETVTSGIELIQHGGGPSTVTMEPKEKALFILYEREPVEASGNNEDALRAHELDFVFPKMANDRKGDTYEKVDFRFSDYIEDYRPTAENIRNWEYEDEYDVVEEHGGSLVDLNAGLLHLYNAEVGLFAPYVDVKRYSMGETIEPQYAYILSRALWEPELRTCSYRDENGMNGYAESVLCIPSSDIGGDTSASVENNVERTLDDTREDAYNFKGKVKVTYEQGEVIGYEDSEGNLYTDQVPEDVEISDAVYGNWQPMEGYVEHQIVSYSITHFADKYRASITPVASIPSAGTENFSQRNNTILGHEAISKQVLNTQVGTTLNVYPEVEYVVWHNGSEAEYSNPEQIGCYVMGEYKRQCVPPMLHGYVSGYTGRNSIGGSHGRTTLASPAMNTTAEKVMKAYEDKGHYENGATQMGTTFTTATDNNPVLKITTFGFDVADEMDGSWGNSFDPKGSHESYVSQYLASTDLNIIMQFYDVNGNIASNPMPLTNDKSDYTVIETEEVIPLKFADGDIVEGKDALIGAIGSAYQTSGDSVYSSWGLDEMLDTMFISNTDPDDKNASGNDLSSIYYGQRKWYDEESIKLEVKMYQTTITFGQCIADDKIDYNLLDQDIRSKYLNQGADYSLEARFFLRWFIDPSMISVDGYSFDNGEGTIRCDEIKESRFVIINQATAER